MVRLVVAAVLTALGGIAGAQAQSFPNRPITIVVPFPAGGSTGAMARILASPCKPRSASRSLSRTSAAPVAAIGAGRVARAAPGRLHGRLQSHGRPTCSTAPI